MKKIRRDAIIGCVVVLLFSVASYVTGWFTLANYQSQTPDEVLDFIYRFFSSTTPIMAVITLITIVRLKAQED